MQWLRSSSHLCGGAGKEGGGGRERKSVCEMVVLGEDAGISQGSRSLQYTTRKRETRLTPCTRSPRLRDANVEKEFMSAWHS